MVDELLFTGYYCLLVIEICVFESLLVILEICVFESLLVIENVFGSRVEIGYTAYLLILGLTKR